MTATKRYIPIGVFCLLIGSISSAMAGSGSSLDPYSMVQAPTAKELEDRTNKARAKKGLPPLPSKSKIAESSLDDVNTNTTYVTAPGGSNGKKVKERPLPQVSSTKVVSDAKAKVSAKETADSNGGVMDGIKTIGAGYTKTFKAATHGAVSATKAASGVVVTGSKKVGDGIVGGAKASGGAIVKGASFVGQGFKATGDKLKESTGGLGERVSSIPGMIGHGFKATGEKMKEGSEKIAGAIPNPFNKGNHKDKDSVVKKAEIATKPPAEKAQPKVKDDELKDDLQDEMIDAKPIAVAPKAVKEELVGKEAVVADKHPSAISPKGIKEKLAHLPNPMKSMGKLKIKMPFAREKKQDVASGVGNKPVF